MDNYTFNVEASLSEAWDHARSLIETNRLVGGNIFTNYYLKTGLNALADAGCAYRQCKEEGGDIPYIKIEEMIGEALDEFRVFENDLRR